MGFAYKEKGTSYSYTCPSLAIQFLIPTTSFYSTNAIKSILEYHEEIAHHLGQHILNGLYAYDCQNVYVSRTCHNTHYKFNKSYIIYTFSMTKLKSPTERSLKLILVMLKEAKDLSIPMVSV